MIPADDFGPAVTGDPFKDRVDVKNASFGVGDDDAFRGLFDGGHQPVQFGFRLLVGGHLIAFGNEKHNLAGLVLDGRDGNVKITELSLGIL